MSTPTPDDDQPMRDALQRDAAGVPEPAFDAALHYETMRRVRSLAETKSAAPRWRLAPTLAAVTAVVALGAIIALWPHSSPPTKPRAMVASLAPRAVAPRASLLAYQAAANESDATLLALLDRDASTLLPASSPLFNTTLP